MKTFIAQKFQSSLMWSISLVMIFLFALTSSSVSAGNDKKEGKCGICSTNGPKAYVKAGAVGNQNGSQNHPFATLKQAQQGKYRTIYVLYSSQALPGGIVLKNGQSLVGIPSGAGDYPVMTNSVDPAISDPNGTSGNGVLVAGGDVCIEKIHFDNTWASAINYDKAKNIDVKNTDVTRFDKGLLVFDVPSSEPRLQKLEIGALQAKIANNGNTRLCNLDISNSPGYSGIGISEISFSGAKRSVDIRESTIHNLVSSLSEDAIPGFFPGFFNDTQGITVGACANTDVYVNISNSVIKDFLGPSVGTRESSRGVNLASFIGGRMKVNIDSTKIHNIADPSGRVGPLALNMLAFSFDVGDSKIKAVVKNSEIINAVNVGGYGVLIGAQNSVGDFKLSGNTISGFTNGVVTISAGLSKDSYEIEKNKGEQLASFLVMVSAASQSPPNALLLRPTTTSSVHDNNFAYDAAVAGSGISIVPQITNPPDNNFPPVPVSWESLTVNAYNNCLVGGPPTVGNAGLVASLGIPVVAIPSGPITVNAHNNNITGFFANIIDLNVGVQFNVQNNWWGGGNPVLVVANPALVNFMPTLSAPIICPQNTGADIED